MVARLKESAAAVASVTFGSAIGRVSFAGLTIIASQVMDADRIGLIGVIFTNIALVQLIFGFGVAQDVSRTLPKLRIAQNDAVAAYLARSMAALLLGPVLLMALGILAGGRLAELYGIQSAGLVVSATLSLSLFAIIWGFIGQLLISLKLTRDFFWLRAFEGTASLVLAYPLIKAFGVMGFALSLLIPQFAIVCAVSWRYRAKARLVAEVSPKDVMQTIRRNIDFIQAGIYSAFPYWLVVYWISSNPENLSSLGYYYIINQVASAALMIGEGVIKSTIPYVVPETVNRNFAVLGSATFRLYMAAVFFVMGLSSVLLVGSADLLARVYGLELGRVESLVSFMALLVVAKGMAKYVINGLLVQRGAGDYKFINLLWSGATIAVYLFFVKIFSFNPVDAFILGLAASYFVAWSIALAMMLLTSNKS
jgi:hypothetical protein